MHVVMVPGIGGSGQRHWQTFWEVEPNLSATRISPSSWDEPDLDDWVEAIRNAAPGHDEDAVIVAHSLGCWAVAEWLARDEPSGVRAFMVAVPDPASAPFPRAEAPTFSGLKPRRLPCATLVVASDDDPYCEIAESRRIARRWGANHHSVGSHGHLNSQSGLGEWLVGRGLLARFVAEVGTQQ